MAAPNYCSSVVPTPTFVPPTENPSETQDVGQKKKRTRNPENWKKEKRKRAILSGQEYINTKGEYVAPRSMGPDCSCKHKCFTAVPSEARESIFKGFYSLKSYDEQNAYLYGLIRRYDVQRKRKHVSDRRTCSYKYFVRIKGRETQICKKAFANIHGISDKKIRTLCIKHEQNILFPRDNRGRHSNRPKKVTPELVTDIQHHILKMLSGTTSTDFIKTDKNQGPDVNISNLYKNYLQQSEPDSLDKETGKIRKDFDCKVKSWLYFKVFHEEFNSIDFHTVKRKLSDLRKSLEASGAIQAKKKPPKSSKPSTKAKQNPPKDPSYGPPQVSSSMYSQQPSFSPLGITPMNSQGGFSHDYVLPNHPDPSRHQPPHMPSYYLCLGHMSNLLPLPSTGSNHPQQPFPSAPQQQFPQPQPLIHTPENHHVIQGHMLQSFNSGHPPHTY